MLTNLQLPIAATTKSMTTAKIKLAKCIYLVNWQTRLQLATCNCHSNWDPETLAQIANANHWESRGSSLGSPSCSSCSCSCSWNWSWCWSWKVAKMFTSHLARSQCPLSEAKRLGDQTIRLTVVWSWPCCPGLRQLQLAVLRWTTSIVCLAQISLID